MPEHTYPNTLRVVGNTAIATTVYECLQCGEIGTYAGPRRLRHLESAKDAEYRHFRKANVLLAGMESEWIYD